VVGWSLGSNGRCSVTSQRTDVAVWLDRHVRDRLSAAVEDVLFRSGRVAAVYGLRLADGGELVAKVHRSPVNLGRLVAALGCQRVLTDAGYPCPTPLDGPATTGSRVAVLESRLDLGERGTLMSRPPTRSATSCSCLLSCARGKEPFRSGRDTKDPKDSRSLLPHFSPASPGLSRDPRPVEGLFGSVHGHHQKGGCAHLEHLLADKPLADKPPSPRP
jgi:hypothetical protein